MQMYVAVGDFVMEKGTGKEGQGGDVCGRSTLQSQ